MKGTPTGNLCRGALSCRNPRHKNAASWVPTGYRSNSIYALVQDLSISALFKMTH
jgi:hypothetical protein